MVPAHYLQQVESIRRLTPLTDFLQLGCSLLSDNGPPCQPSANDRDDADGDDLHAIMSSEWSRHFLSNLGVRGKPAIVKRALFEIGRLGLIYYKILQFKY